MTRTITPFLGGVAKVFCVHDREKRVVTDPELVTYLGLVAGQVFDPRRHKLQNCACCSNLFVTDDDTPRLCSVCTGPLAHAPAAPLPAPEGVI